jgi:hypothetical protein
MDNYQELDIEESTNLKGYYSKKFYISLVIASWMICFGISYIPISLEISSSKETIYIYKNQISTNCTFFLENSGYYGTYELKANATYRDKQITASQYHDNIFGTQITNQTQIPYECYISTYGDKYYVRSKSFYLPTKNDNFKKNNSMIMYGIGLIGTLIISLLFTLCVRIADLHDINRST